MKALFTLFAWSTLIICFGWVVCWLSGDCLPCPKCHRNCAEKITLNDGTEISVCRACDYHF